MAIGEAVGEFSFTSTSSTVSASPDGGASTQVNLEGTASGYGTVLGTMTFFADAPGAKSGTTSWVGTGYLENGDQVGGLGQGVFQESGTHKWRVRSLIQISDGTVILTDGEIALDGRTYVGTIHAWE